MGPGSSSGLGSAVLRACSVAWLGSRKIAWASGLPRASSCWYTRILRQADFFSEPWLARRCGCRCWELQGPSRAGDWALGQCGQLPALLGRIPPPVEISVSGPPGDGGHSSPWRGAGVPRDQRLPGACSSSGATGKRSRHTGLGGCRVGNSAKDRLSCWHTATGRWAVPGGPARWDWRAGGGPQSIPPLLCHPPGPAGEKASERDTGQQGWPVSTMSWRPGQSLVYTHLYKHTHTLLYSNS